MELHNLNTAEGRKHLPEGWSFDPVKGIVELAADVSVESVIGEIRSLRRIKIESVTWAVDRHLRQVRLGKSTTLTPQEFVALETYIEALCDFTEVLEPDQLVRRGDVVNGLDWPQAPETLLPKIMRRDGGFF